MTSRDRERSGSLFGPTSHEPPPEPVPASPDPDTKEEGPVYASESYRPDCSACAGTGYVPGDDPEPEDCPRCIKPKLNQACEALRRECGLWISAKDIGDCPDGVLWSWEILTPGGDRLPVAICHDRSSHDKELLVFLTGFRLGQRTIPF